MAGETEASIAQQLLDITRLMLNSGNSFTLKLSMSNVNFCVSNNKKETPPNVNNNKKETPSNVVKKTRYKPPSQKERDNTRKQNFLKQKLEIPNSAENSEKLEMTPRVLLYCDVCDFTTPTKGDFDTHTRRKHNYIEQQDGHASVEFVGSLNKDGDEIYLSDFCDQRGKTKNMKKIDNNEYQNHSYTCDQDCKKNFK